MKQLLDLQPFQLEMQSLSVWRVLYVFTAGIQTPTLARQSVTVSVCTEVEVKSICTH